MDEDIVIVDYAIKRADTLSGRLMFVCLENPFLEAPETESTPLLLE
ncbi:hypothetical protein [Haloterrigena salinisoli]